MTCKRCQYSENMVDFDPPLCHIDPMDELKEDLLFLLKELYPHHKWDTYGEDIKDMINELEVFGREPSE